MNQRHEILPRSKTAIEPSFLSSLMDADAIAKDLEEYTKAAQTKMQFCKYMDAATFAADHADLRGLDNILTLFDFDKFNTAMAVCLARVAREHRSDLRHFDAFKDKINKRIEEEYRLIATHWLYGAPESIQANQIVANWVKSQF